MTWVGPYADVKTVLDAALRNKGGVYTLPTRGAAVKWRQRAYKYRNLLRKKEEEVIAHIPGAHASTPYDHIILQLGPKPTCDVVIAFHAPSGTFRAPDGTEVELKVPENVKSDFDDAASEVARRLRGGPANETPTGNKPEVDI